MQLLCSCKKGKCFLLTKAAIFLKLGNWRIGEQNKGNVENKGGNGRDGVVIRVWGISVGMQKIWVEMEKMLGIRVVMQGIKVET